MSGLFILLAVLTVVAVLGILAQTFGADSRADFEDPAMLSRGLVR